MVTSEPMTVGKRSTGRRSAEPRERAFVMSGEDVRAALAGQKTQARRVMAPQPALYEIRKRETRVLWPGKRPPATQTSDRSIWSAAFGVPGDRLRVRETWAGDDCCGYVYRADHPNADLRAGDLDDGEQSIRRWHSPATMPRNAARLILTLAALRVERVQDITLDDIIAEGIPVPPVDYTVAERPDVLDYERKCFAREAFASRWDRDHRRHPEHQWAANPWVWVPEFTVERLA